MRKNYAVKWKCYFQEDFSAKGKVTVELLLGPRCWGIPLVELEYDRDPFAPSEGESNKLTRKKVKERALGLAKGVLEKIRSELDSILQGSPGPGLSRGEVK